MVIKSKLLFIIGVGLLAGLLGVIFFDIVLFIKNNDHSIVLRIIEILLTTGTSISITLSIEINAFNNNSGSIDFSKNKREININGSDTNNSNMFNKPVVFDANKSSVSIIQVGPGIEEMIKVYNDVLLPQQKINMEEIARKTYEEQAKNKPTKEIDKDFVLKYIEESKNITDKDIQDIWVKLLILDSKKGNDVSKRTLDIIKNMTSKEAKIFEKIAKYAFKNGTIPKSFDSNFDWSEVSLLQDIRLLKSGDFIKHYINVHSSSNSLICHNDKLVLVAINNGSNDIKIEIDCYVLTLEGLQLKNALNVNISNNDIIELGKKIKGDYKGNKDLIIGVYSINYLYDGGVNYDSSNNLLDDE